MDILKSRFYRINERMLGLVGQWPYQDRKTRRIRQIFFQISVISVILVQGIRLVEIWGDLDIMIECLTPMGVQFCSCIKCLNCSLNQEKMMRLMEAIKRDWSNLKKKDEIKILSKYAEEGRRLSVLYTFFMYGTVILYLILPLVPKVLNIVLPRNESRPYTALYWTEYFVDPEKYFWPIVFHTYGATLITISGVIAADAMFVSYVQHACGTLAIVGHRMEILMNNRNIEPSKDDERTYRELVLCVDRHLKTLEFAALIENAHSMAFLMQTGVSMVLLSISAVQLLIKFGQYQEMIRLVQFNLAQSFHILYNSLPGQRLLDESTNFRNSVYFSKWYYLPMRGKTLVRIIMLRTMTPIRLTAGKLYDLSLENFGAVIRASVSYFTVFASLR